MIGGISIWQLLIVLLIVVLLFGTKKLRSMGGDLGSAIKNFRGAMRDGEKEAEEEAAEKPQLSREETGKPGVDAEREKNPWDSQQHSGNKA